MGTLDKLKAMFGIGAARVSIELPSFQFELGAPVAGKVQLAPGKACQEITAVSVSVIKRVNTPIDDGIDAVNTGFEKMGAAPDSESEVQEPNPPIGEDDEAGEAEETSIASTTLAEDFTLEPGDEKAFAFSLDLGDDAEPSSDAVTWILFARADIPTAIDATCWQKIELAHD